MHKVVVSVAIMGFCLLLVCVGCESKVGCEYPERDRQRENMRVIQERAQMEEVLEQAWNKYRTTKDPKLRAELEKYRNDGYVINGQPLRELLDKY